MHGNGLCVNVLMACFWKEQEETDGIEVLPALLRFFCLINILADLKKNLTLSALYPVEFAAKPINKSRETRDSPVEISKLKNRWIKKKKKKLVPALEFD